MQLKFNHFAQYATGILALLALPALTQAQYAYDVVPIEASVYGLNNEGQVAITLGVLQSDGTYVAHAGYFSNGIYYDAQPGSKQPEFGTAISDSGLLAISPGPFATDGYPAIYNLNTGDTRVLVMLAYDNYGYYTPSLIASINTAGDTVVKQRWGVPILYHYSTDQVETVPLTNTQNCLLNAINNKGLIVGALNGGAASYSNGTFYVLGPFMGNSEANGINDRGDIVGDAYVSQFVQHAFLYHNGQLKDLGTVQNDDAHSSLGLSINSAGDVVGVSGDLPFLYRNGQMQNLLSLIDPLLGYTDGIAIAINDHGWILCRSSSANFLLVPNRSVSGTVALDGVDDAGSLTEPFTFTLTPKDVGTPIVQTQVLSAGGAFSLSQVSSGNYTLSVKGSKWLSASQSVSVTSDSVSGLNFFLGGGDANNDNTVDIADFDVLVNAYNGDANIPGSGYDSAADFNGDGVVDVSDFGIFVNSYNRSGQ